MSLFRYPLGQRVRVATNAHMEFVIVRRRYEEGEISHCVQYALLPATMVADTSRVRSGMWYYEADIEPVPAPEASSHA